MRKISKHSFTDKVWDRFCTNTAFIFLRNRNLGYFDMMNIAKLARERALKEGRSRAWLTDVQKEYKIFRLEKEFG